MASLFKGGKNMKMRNHWGWFAIRLFVTMIILLVFAFAVAEETDVKISVARPFLNDDDITDRTYYYYQKRCVWPEKGISEEDGDREMARNWMAGISGERRINEINIPGTHDSSMKEPYAAGRWRRVVREYARTQDSYIYTQLDFGIRAFDLRLYHKYEDSNGEHDNSSSLFLLHGKLSNLRYWATEPHTTNLDLNRVFDYMKAFLMNHPTETIIVYLRPETDGKDAKKTIMERAREYVVCDLLYDTNLITGEPFLYVPDGNDYPKLKDCRGKIVIRCNYDELKDYAISIDKDRPGVTQQDDWKLSSDEKIAWANDFYNNNKKDLPDAPDEHFEELFDIWLSSSGHTTIGGIPKHYPSTIAEEVNGALFGAGKLFDTHSEKLQHARYLGWVSMDFATAKEAAYIWKSNFLCDEYCYPFKVKSGIERQDLTQTYVVRRGASITIPPDIYDYDRASFGHYLNSWKLLQNGGEVGTYAPGDSCYLASDLDTKETFEGKWEDGNTIPLVIRWEDEEDADGLREKNSVEIGYKTEVGSFTKKVSRTDDWKSFVPADAEDLVLKWDLPSGKIDPDKNEGQGEDKEGQYQYAMQKEDSGWILTLKHTPVTAKIHIEPKIVWQDADDKDKLRPDALEIHLFADGKEWDDADSPHYSNKDDGWFAGYWNVPLFIDGKKVKYTLVEKVTGKEEAGIPGYTVVYDGFNIVNTHTPEDKVYITGNMIWNDDQDRDKIRPEEVTLNLFLGDELIGSAVSAAEKEWAYDFGEFEKYKDGIQAEYRMEGDLDGYSAKMELNETDGTYRIILTHELTVKDISGWISWEDDNAVDRPESVTLFLWADDKELDHQVINKPEGNGEDEDDDTWEWSFGERYSFERGEEIRYSVTEEAIEGYLTWIDESGRDILNSKKPAVVLDFGMGHEDLAAVYSGKPGYTVFGTQVTQYVESSAKIDPLPEIPTLNGYYFKGWYRVTGKGQLADEPFNFETPITESLTLKPVWTIAATYVNAEGNPQSTEARPVFADTEVWSGGWYAFVEDIEIKSRVTVRGDVNLILGDGKNLDVSAGICVEQGSSLTIWAQEDGNGALTAIGQSHRAGIGSDDQIHAGIITIYGGTVTTTGGTNAAGIGGGYRHDGGNITIHGGTVKATGGSSGAGIGGGSGGKGGTIAIHGGTVNAEGGKLGAGIGGGYKADGGEITIDGGTVKATGGSFSTGIGGGGNLTPGSSATTAKITLDHTVEEVAVSVYADAYNGIMTLVKLFAAESANEVCVFEPGNYEGEQLDAFGGLTLKNTETVSFDSDGGSEVKAQVLPEGAKAERPEDPTKEECALVCWETDKGEPFDFENTPIIESITLKAVWGSMPFGDPLFTLPTSTRSIANQAFVGTGMTSVWIHDECKLLGDQAFANSKALQKIRIPKGCEFIGNPFLDCEKVYIFSAADNSFLKMFCDVMENCVFVAEKQEQQAEGIAP